MSIFNNQSSKYDADVVVIGSGAGGSVALQTLAESGKKIILIEESKLGGDCANYSCVPTKAMLQTVNSWNELNNASKYGINITDYSIDFERLKHWVSKAVQNTGIDNYQNAFQKNKVGIINGHAHFINPNTVSVGLKRISAHKFIIATGASIKVPDIKNIDKVEYLTYKNFLNIKKLPKAVGIIGGGAIAYEYAQVLIALGVSVHIFEKESHLLPDLDCEVGDIATSVLSGIGVRVHLKSKVMSVKKTSASIVIEHQNHGQSHHVSVDQIMLACGHNPNVDIGLENAKVTYTDEGILVKSNMQTSNPNIYAIGDAVIGGYGASTAIRQGQIASHNLIHRKKEFLKTHALPNVLYGSPEIATVGITEQSIKLTGKPYQTAIAPIGIIGRSYSSDYKQGFVKIIASHQGVILGASVVSPHAGEIITELTYAVQYHQRACNVSNTIHPFGSWSEAVRVATSKIYCI